MASDFEQLLRDLFGSVSQFSSEQTKKLQSRVQEFVREALKDELTKLHGEIAELRSRVAVLESERAQAAADAIEPSF